jgi:hypothetical protein
LRVEPGAITGDRAVVVDATKVEEVPDENEAPAEVQSEGNAEVAEEESEDESDTG